MKNSVLINEIAAERDQIKNKIQYCWNPACLGKPKKAVRCHTLSETKQLSVYTGNRCLIYKPHSGNIFKGVEPDFSETYISGALVFRGFCGSCDNRLFIDLDDAATATDEVARQQGLRSIAYRFWDNRLDYELSLLISRKTGFLTSAQPPAMSTHPYFGSCRASENQYTEWSFEKARDSYLNSESENLLCHTFFELSSDPGFRASCAAPLTFCISGAENPINWIDSKRMPLIIVSVLNIGTKYYIVVSFEKILNKFGKIFLRDIKNISENLNKLLHCYFFVNNVGGTFSVETFRRSIPRRKRVALEIEKNRKKPDMKRFIHSISKELTTLPDVEIINVHNNTNALCD